ncbi:MAG: DegT/DnrJ/EryC1/StrS family aminotransferase [Oligoflexia bacterium]|nr:DegT/DnrJ/EryC1/StrS family aminotransferase [Oligoflexia bacterium]
MKIPFVDLQSQLKPIRNQINEGINGVLDKCNFILGDDVKKFEDSFAKYCGAKYAIGISSGLDAIHLAMRALEIGEGDEVITQANTFIATALGITMAGAKPVLVDANESNFLMNVEQIEKAITPKTKAIMPVHLYGRMTDMTPIMKLAKKHDLHVVEDAAQSHGAQLFGARAGSVGAMGCFSFYPGKNLGCYGDGGMVVTNDPQLKDKVEALRNYGSIKKYHHPIVGFNNRLDTMQAAILNVKLPHLDAYNSARFEAAIKYNKALEGIGDLVLPEIPEKKSHVFHLYVLKTKKRDQLLEFLNNQGVQAGIHYPIPVHMHGAYAHLGYKTGSFPVSEKMASEILSLPMFPELNDVQIDYVKQKVKEFFSK